jgi:hypothetical protein
MSRLVQALQGMKWAEGDRRKRDRMATCKRKGVDELEPAWVEGWLAMAVQGCQADPALISPFEPHFLGGTREARATG